MIDIDLVFILWAMVATATTAVYTLCGGRLLKTKWDGVIKGYEVLLILVCLPILTLYLLMFVVLGSGHKILTCKFKFKK